MKISTQKGNFKIIQTIKNRDELLVLGSWIDIVNSFESKRAFLVNKEQGLFGIYLCKQECNSFISKLMQGIDYNEWEDFKLEDQNSFQKYLA